MNIFFIGVVVSILVYIVVGIWAGRSVKDVNDYYVSGRNAEKTAQRIQDSKRTRREADRTGLLL